MENAIMWDFFHNLYAFKFILYLGYSREVISFYL